MEFEKKPLPNFVVADLYKKNLFVIDTNTTPNYAPNTDSLQGEVSIQLNFLGENKKQICIVLKEENAVHISEYDLVFLTNILAACKLNIADVAIINLQQQKVDFNLLKEKLGCKFLLLFNVTTNTINLPFMLPNYQVQAYSGSSILTASSFSSMQGNTQEAKIEKSKLWISLKNMFSI